MKCKILFFILLFVLNSCKKESINTSEDWHVISENVRFKDDTKTFELQSGKFKYAIPQSKLPYQKVILLNASLVGYLAELGLEEKIAGISSPEYVFSPVLNTFIANGTIQNIGNEQKYDIEKIIAAKPDAVFTNYISSFDNTYDLLRKNGIEIIFLDEYLEQDPVKKAEYLLVFGKLLGAEKQAAERLGSIRAAYDSLKNLAKKAHSSPIVLANEMYGNQWFLPGGKTGLAQLIKDANAQYINAQNTDSKAIPMSFEEVMVRAEKAEFWVNVGNHRTKKELLSINPNYTQMPVYHSGKLYTVSGRERGRANDFFESGVVRADIVLKDYIKIFHPELLPEYELIYLKELK